LVVPLTPTLPAPKKVTVVLPVTKVMPFVI